METEEYQNTSRFQNLLLILSVYVVIELYVGTILAYPDGVKETLKWVDFCICMLFLYDFFNGFFRTGDKWKYFKANWIDLVSSIPTIDALRMGRIVRVIRILRVLRSAKYIFNAFSRKNSFNTFRNLMIISGMIILFFTLSFYHREKNANPHIVSMSDSFWWTTVTTITVGFLQDIPPVTVESNT